MMVRGAGWFLALCLALGVGSPPATGAEVEVPLQLQISVFRKVFSFDRTLPSGQARVVVLYGGQDRVRANSVAEAFQAAGVPAVAGSAAALGPEAGNVIYLLPGADHAAIRKHCVSNGFLSISGAPAMVERGEATLGLGVGGGGRTEIWVHLPRLKEEKHELDSGLLRLAHVIR